MVPILRLVHPAPTLAVVTLSAALAAILGSQSGSISPVRLVLTTAAVLGSQIVTGALNDWADRDRDRLTGRAKPIAEGRVSAATALAVAGFGALVQLAASIPLGGLALLLGAAASASAVAYNLWLSRTPLSVLPYLVSFGLLPLWIAAGMDVPLERVAAAPLLVGPFAAAAHLANTLRDFDTDARIGSRSLAQVLGRRRAFGIAFALAMAVGIAVGVSFTAGGSLDLLTAILGLAGLAAVAQGVAGPGRLWAGMLIAAVVWTAAWALGTG
jgi:4-hydroxybenzoate polyprenyltransferase